MNDFAFSGELGQGGADLGGADATEFLQLLNRDRFLELGQRSAYPFGGGGALAVGEAIRQTAVLQLLREKEKTRVSIVVAGPSIVVAFQNLGVFLAVYEHCG